MKALMAVFRIRWKEETQYRGAALGGILCQVFFGLILISVYRALYETKPQTMPLQDVVTYVWLQQSMFRMLLSSDTELADKIRTGAFAYDLCRPLEPYAYYYIRGMAQKIVGSGMRAVPMILIAILLPDGWGLRAPVSFPACLIALISLFLGLACACALDGISTGFTVRTLDPRGIQALMNMLMMTFSGNIIPLTLFPDHWQHVIFALPYAQLLDVPIRLYTGVQPLTEIWRIWGLQMFWLVLLTASGILLWKRNSRRIVVQGG